MLILKYKNDPHYKFSLTSGATPWNILVTLVLWVASGILWWFDNLAFAIAAFILGVIMCIVNAINSAGDFLREKSVRQPAKLSRMISSVDWFLPVGCQMSNLLISWHLFFHIVKKRPFIKC